jgi:DNA-binding MarR family transcriptional regulator
MAASGKLIYQISREMRYLIGRRLAAHGLFAVEYDILSLLLEGTPAPQEAIVESANVEKSAVAKSLRRLEQANVIQRCSDPEDRRRRWITWDKHADAVLADVSALRSEIADALSHPHDERVATEILEAMAASIHRHVERVRRNESGRG